MSNNRIKIDAAAGVFELEGEAEFIEAQLDKLLPLVKAGRFTGAQTPAGENGNEIGHNAEDAKPNEVKKSRKRSNLPPKGHSCANRMMSLRAEGYFKEQKTPSQIVERLGTKGWIHTSNQVSAAGGQMFNRGDIQRTKVGNGFAYYWDRE